MQESPVDCGEEVGENGLGKKGGERQGRIERKRERQAEHCREKESRNKRTGKCIWYVFLFFWCTVIGWGIGGGVAIKYALSPDGYGEGRHRNPAAEKPTRGRQRGAKHIIDKGLEIDVDSNVEQHLVTQSLESWRHEKWKALHVFWKHRAAKKNDLKKSMLS